MDHHARGGCNVNPMSYQGESGKQFVAVVAGNTLMVYSL